jgi:hypothetical protein
MHGCPRAGTVHGLRNLHQSSLRFARRAERPIEAARAGQSDGGAKSISQWQEPHARAPGFYRQQSPSFQLCCHTA